MTSNKGRKYVMVLYAYDLHNILAEQMKNMSQQETVRAHQATQITY